MICCFSVYVIRNKTSFRKLVRKSSKLKVSLWPDISHSKIWYFIDSLMNEKLWVIGRTIRRLARDWNDHTLHLFSKWDLVLRALCLDLTWTAPKTQYLKWTCSPTGYWETSLVGLQLRVYACVCMSAKLTASCMYTLYPMWIDLHIQCSVYLCIFCTSPSLLCSIRSPRPSPLGRELRLLAVGVLLGVEGGQ